MPAYDPVALDSTPPTIDSNGIAHFDLDITLRGTPTGNITLECTPSNALVLNNPYTFSGSTGTISLVSNSAITTTIQVLVKVTADGGSLCRNISLCPTGTACPAAYNVDCPGGS